MRMMASTRGQYHVIAGTHTDITRGDKNLKDID